MTPPAPLPAVEAQSLAAQIVAMLRAIGNRPRVHGNGFIQLDLSASTRLHVWGDPRIPRQAVETPRHNHQFGFVSSVLYGAIRQREYEAVEDCFMGDYQPHTARVRHGEDTVLAPIGPLVNLKLTSERIIRAGESYSMRAGEIHESEPCGLSVSVIVKDAPSLAQGGVSPLVYVPFRTTPDNAFDRYATPAEDLWQIITETLLAAIPSPQTHE